ncbi:MAG: hypothetical protein Q7R88_03145, partial [bacterium]|nr:hypothetical protein [bacterium]
LKMFKEMEQAIANQIMGILPQIGGQLPEEKRAALQEVHEQAQLIGSGDEESDSKHHGNQRSDLGSGKRSDLDARFAGVGRNDPCPCGAINPNTGKVYKFKQCGLINAPHHRR